MSGIFTRNELKFLALATMLCDHVAVVLIYDARYYTLMRIIGRIAFPIFAYFLVQGFLHTSNYRKYLVRIGIFALLSEIPFDLAFQWQVLEFGSQNVMFTLLIALVMLHFLRKWEGKLFMVCLTLVSGGMAGWIFRTDYEAFGVLVIGWFYLLRSARHRGIWYALPFFFDGGVEVFGSVGAWCCLLNREEGEERIRLPKYLFYLFYPLHLLFLWAVREIVQ